MRLAARCVRAEPLRRFPLPTRPSDLRRLFVRPSDCFTDSATFSLPCFVLVLAISIFRSSREKRGGYSPQRLTPTNATLLDCRGSAGQSAAAQFHGPQRRNREHITDEMRHPHAA